MSGLNWRLSGRHGGRRLALLTGSELSLEKQYGKRSQAQTGTRNAANGADPAQPVASLQKSAVFQCRCLWSDNGKVKAKIENGPMGSNRFIYVYDQAGRLTEVHKNDSLAEFYQYDEGGRRIRDFRAWALARRIMTYNLDGALLWVAGFRRGQPELCPASSILGWTDKGQLATLHEDGRKSAYFYGSDSRLDRALLCNGKEVRYAYGQGLMPQKISVNDRVVAEYQWQDSLRLLQYKDLVRGLLYDFVYASGRTPLRVLISGSREAMFQATGHHVRQLILNSRP